LTALDLNNNIERMDGVDREGEVLRDYTVTGVT